MIVVVIEKEEIVNVVSSEEDLPDIVYLKIGKGKPKVKKEPKVKMEPKIKQESKIKQEPKVKQEVFMKMWIF